MSRQLDPKPAPYEEREHIQTPFGPLYADTMPFSDTPLGWFIQEKLKELKELKERSKTDTLNYHEFLASIADRLVYSDQTVTRADIAHEILKVLHGET